MVDKEQEYYRRRVAQERAAAQNVTCAYAREVHLDLAERYSAKLRLMEALASASPFSEPQLQQPPLRRAAMG